MKQPFWKCWLSYFFEMHIESAPSELNPHLYVSLSKGRYQLSTEHAVYSYGDLYNNFKKAFLKLDLDKHKIENVLILGFGLGSIPMILEQKFAKDYNYTAVEIDENVLYLADKYTMPDIKSSIQFINANAFTFAEICQEQYDMICMDVFLDDVIPSDFEGKNFLENLRDLLADNGILLYNRLSLTNGDKRRTKAFFENKFKTVFPNAYPLDVEGNWILINDKLFLK